MGAGGTDSSFFYSSHSHHELTLGFFLLLKAVSIETLDN